MCSFAILHVPNPNSKTANAAAAAAHSLLQLDSAAALAQFRRRKVDPKDIEANRGRPQGGGCHLSPCSSEGCTTHTSPGLASGALSFQLVIVR